MERRRNGKPSQSPIETLRQLPALVLLDRLPVAAVAVADDGVVVFANHAACEMLGYDPDELTRLDFPTLFRSRPRGMSPVAAVREFAGVIVELQHRDGSLVRAKMSRSALLRDGDTVALVTFQDMTEQLWVQEI